MFIKAEVLLLEDVEAVSALMAGHAVTRHDIMQACLCNTSKSVMPILYARRFIPGFDLPAFLVELVSNILHQPYRGSMLQ